MLHKIFHQTTYLHTLNSPFMTRLKQKTGTKTKSANRITNSANRTLIFIKRNIKTKITEVREVAYIDLATVRICCGHLGSTH